MTHPLLQLVNVKTHFPIFSGTLFRRQSGAIKAVDGVSLNLQQGEILGLAGESGCGKSTLGRTILQLIPATHGQIFFQGTDLCSLVPEEIRTYRSQMQMIFQDPYASLNPRMTVYDTLVEALTVHQTTREGELQDKVVELMGKVGLDPRFLKKYPHEFSGGQRQRIAIGRALAPQPQLIIADEPVSALDVSIQSQIINLIKQLCREMGLTILFIGHDLSVMKYIADRIAVMYLGKIVEIGQAEEVIEDPLHPYTQALVSAIPEADPAREKQRRRIVLEGEPPSPLAPPQGCAFHPRCRYAQANCQTIIPPFTDIAGHPSQAACLHLDKAQE